MLRTKYTILLVVYSLITLLWSCREKNEEFVFDPCSYDFEECLFTDPILDPVGFFDPVFLGNGEIAYRVRNNHTASYSLIAHDLVSGNKRLISSDFFSVNKLSYRNGWIAYTDSDWKVNLINVNTGFNKRITNTPRDMAPRFNRDGSLLCYSRAYLFSNQELEDKPERIDLYKMVICDLNGNTLDTFCASDDQGVCRLWEENYQWHTDSTFVALYRNEDYSDYGIALYNLKGKLLEVLIQIPHEEVVQKITLSSNTNKLYYITNRGINEFDLISKSHQLIKGYCRNRYYTTISISEDGKHLLSSVGENIILGKCKSLVKSYIVIISLESDLETRVVG